ncbi:hypothetical protein PPL_07003 [Heterostelium album PN500]|uniref:Uncharacterized protein n=1 Tax=Heterostelium pallidum (strain ATCC 26659 / Pp 5 / PN500) TaxID=670386 RepID=D3BE50_HETP5|nr:hypothetical protein PPL_07003 [Heterostelium album PN500]EFA80181.1 hypothetical protein PPL_07003 [Heterostelium album PN500]|eukprot:XP_020432301.1 hypothetical protein PPL_07003 [Heterostelium album PN500]
MSSQLFVNLYIVIGCLLGICMTVFSIYLMYLTTNQCMAQPKRKNEVILQEPKSITITIEYFNPNNTENNNNNNNNINSEYESKNIEMSIKNSD